MRNRLFRRFCLCSYDAALWNKFTAVAFNKFIVSYIECTQKVFDLARSVSLESLLHELNILYGHCSRELFTTSNLYIYTNMIVRRLFRVSVSFSLFSLFSLFYSTMGLCLK